jgi:hypothetical protein
LILGDTDLVVVGGPAQLTRTASPESVRQRESEQTSEPVDTRSALGWPGVRGWLGSMGQVAMLAAAFDTRIMSRAVFARRASKAMSRELVHHGMTVIVPPASFLVDEVGRLAPSEAKRAEAWGANLGAALYTRRVAG